MLRLSWLQLLVDPFKQAMSVLINSEPAEDPKQPNANNTTMYMWSTMVCRRMDSLQHNDTESV